jgi:2-dehydro-3-deoxygalactonokinase
MTTPRLIALDWGTSNLRASLLGPGGALLDRRAGSDGVMAVPSGAFEAALRALCGDWLDAGSVPIVASGMVGSRQGWVEAPYLDAPATLAHAARRLTPVALAGDRWLHIVPGVQGTGADGQPDVMRGEETQVWGAALPDGTVCVLPGTHSKWVWTGTGGAIDRFATYLTGELYAVLVQHSILGRLMAPGTGSPDAFAAGAALGLAEPAHLSHLLFTVRTNGLTGRFAPGELPDFLSGLLIGAEVGSALARPDGPRPVSVVLLGEASLVARYAVALRAAGVAVQRAPDDVTPRGQWRVAVAAGLVADL